MRLRDAAEKAWNVRELGFYDRYAARSGLLHGEVFYEGFWAPGCLGTCLRRLGGYVS